jgi:hypothetical protein
MNLLNHYLNVWLFLEEIVSVVFVHASYLSRKMDSMVESSFLRMRI